MAVLGAASLAGCSFAPAPQHPAIPVPALYPEESAPLAGNGAAQIGWEAFFGDAQVKALIGRALANNRDLRVAAARIEQARAALRARGADLAPQLAGSAGMVKAGLPESFSQMLREDTLTSYDGMLQTSWEIDLFGRLRSLRTAALQQYLASTEARRGLATILVAQVAAGCLADREYAERLELARETLANRERALQILTRRYELGSGSRIEVTQAETLRTQAAGAIQSIELSRAQNRTALALLVGAPVEEAALTHSLAEMGRVQSIPAGLPSELLANRPDIVAAEHQLRGAEANIGAARAAFFPSISLTGAVGTTSNDLDGLFGAGTGLWLFRPTASLPIFTAGKLRASLRASEAQRDEMIATYEKTIQSAFRDVVDALAQRRWLNEQIATTEQAIAALSERSRLATIRFEAGRAAYLEVLDAERDRFSAQQQLVQLRRAWLASGVALYAALGGGFSEPEGQGQMP
ncbi:efflux transporter outer membrane subunit [Sphingobium lignivorans]|uniref:NodT family efflux transporter outer membrane factor (OMF) lipoprotein n=1 Tax=Sphingobium lignivorans TaxID=2735886 RepID=A0ABR6NBN1_9SPHN|nr:efflux transporter outer membrane subunit [Sphingobium lignivorans]MBB5984691.1 NodT family efflux transporter outer membrane factor (OMF) lipoprotein [Sphingobium lignivorans]